jgi:putative ABC transport system ATP-binding protein
MSKTAERRTQPADTSSKPLIKLVGLHKSYHMGLTNVHALAGVDLEIGQGEFVSIIGPSGSGKSTMMGIIGCLDRPSRGNYYLETLPVSSLSDRHLARIRNERIGFVFQTFNLLPRTTAAENVAVPLFYARKLRTQVAAIEALEQVGLADRATHTPAELSGGERQRVAIARAIVNRPKLLLADEPTGNLDTRTGAQIMMIFHELHQRGVTVVLVTHEHDIAVQTERMVQMRDGKIISDGPVDPAERQRAIELARQLAQQPPLNDVPESK